MREFTLVVALSMIASILSASEPNEPPDGKSKRVEATSLPDAKKSNDDELSEGDKKIATETKQQAVNEIKNQIAQKERDRRDAQKARSIERVRAINLEIESLKKDLAIRRRKSINSYLKEAQANAIAERQKEARRMEELDLDRQVNEAIKNAGPIAIIEHGITMNVINIPQLSIKVQNTTDQIVEAFEVDAECYDKFGDKVSLLGRGNLFRGLSQDKVKAGAVQRIDWPLSLQQNTAVADVWISRVKLADGTEWTQTKEEAKKRGPAAFVKTERTR
jgi:hypothetical protein